MMKYKYHPLDLKNMKRYENVLLFHERRMKRWILWYHMIIQ